MIKQLTLLIYIFLLSSSFFAQEGRVAISGRITNNDSSVENIHILNKISNTGTISNTHGEFQISVKENDTLIISGIQFYYKIIPIAKQHTISKVILIELFQKTNELDEVEVRAHNLLGNLSLDSNKAKDSKSLVSKGVLDFSMIDFSIPVTSKIDEIDRITPPDISHLVNPMAQGAGAGVSLGTHITKQEKKLKTLKKEEKNLKTIRNLFSDEFFTETLKIPKEEIDAFIIYCKSKGILNSSVKKNTELIDKIIRESRNFKN